VKTNNQNKVLTETESLKPGFREILKRGRLTEDDLDRFHANILKTQKRKSGKVLLISSLLVISGLCVIYFIV
tara:strand:+ start:1369 stop:1584 length:216 start_codon:yes stop_codon:yes gene_type:complete